MTGPAILAITLIGFVLVLRAPLKAATVTLLIGLVVLPEALPLPIGFEYLSISRLLLWVYAVGLALRVWRREVPEGLLRPTRVHLVFAVFIVVAAVNGIVLGLQPNPRFEAFLGWLTLADQLLLFTVAVAICRAFGPWWLARAIVILSVALGVIAYGERYLGLNWNHFFFEGTASRLQAGSAGQGYRGGQIRVRGPSQFALEFGWIFALLTPVAMAVVSRTRSTLARLLPAVLTMGAVWTVSRSALLGIAVGAAALALGARDRRITGFVLIAGGIALVIAVQSTTFTDPFKTASPDSAASRVRRIAIITEQVEERPLIGLGIAGPRSRGVYGTDTSYVLLYAQLGVIGITALGILILTSLVVAAGSLRGPPSDARTLGAAAVATIMVGFVATASFDHFSIAGSTRIYWSLVAIGVVLNERRARVPSRARLAAPGVPVRVVPRVALVIGAIAVGFVVRQAAPAHFAWDAQFDTVPPGFTEKSPTDPAFTGRFLINTTCTVLQAATDDLDVKFSCLEPRLAPTVGDVRIEAANLDDARRAVKALRDQLRTYLSQDRFYVTLPFVKGRPTWSQTAPVSFGMGGLALALLLPARRRGPRWPSSWLASLVARERADAGVPAPARS